LRCLFHLEYLLPEGKLISLVRKYIRVDDLRPDTFEGKSVLDQVRGFETESLAGKYYQAFSVNSTNCTKKSPGSTAWIATCRRLLDECVHAVRHGEQTDAQQSFDVLFGLLDKIDDFRVDIIFFADEHGSLQVGVDWETVLPAWFVVPSATAEPEEYARRIGQIVDRHCGYVHERFLTIAGKAATREQRVALEALPVDERRRR
jgi:hypothetical protein